MSKFKLIPVSIKIITFIFIINISLRRYKKIMKILKMIILSLRFFDKSFLQEHFFKLLSQKKK